MMETRRFGIADSVLFLAILAGAAGIRFGYVSSCCHQGTDEGPYQVQEDWQAERDLLVTSLKEGRGFVGKDPLTGKEEVTAHTSIGYPWLLSLVDGSWVNVPSDQLVRWLQCGLGALAAGLYFLTARRAFHSLLVGTLAGILCAVHPVWVINTAELNDGTLASFLLALCLFLGVRGGQSGGALTSLLYGLVLAGLACVRAPYLPFAFAAVLWFLYRCQTLPRGWLYAVLAVLGFVNGLIPWTIRNYQTFHTVMPLVDSTFLHLWVGNNSPATGGPESEATMRGALPEGTRWEELPQSERYLLLGKEVVSEVVNNPAGTCQRRLWAGLGFFFGTNWLKGGSLERETGVSRDDLPDRVAQLMPTLLPGSLLGMLVLGVLGWRWTYGWRREAMPSSLAVVWIPLPYLLSHAEAFHGPRLPLDGVLLCYTAFVLGCVVPSVGKYLLRGEDQTV